MKKLILIFLNFVVSTTALANNLSCSANGLNIIYINGVNVPVRQAAVDSAKKVSDALTPIKGELDKKKLNPVYLVHNQSLQLINDIEELKAQLAANHQGKKRIDYWRKQASNNLILSTDFLWKDKIDEALKQIIKSNSYDKDGKFISDQDAYSQSDLYKDLAIYNIRFADMLASAASDVAVVEQLKIQIREAYNNGKNKLIVVSHSQGNEVLYSAIKSIRNNFTTPGEVKRFDAFVGYMQVAPPSPRLVVETATIVDDVIVNDPNNIPNFYPDHAQYIRHNKDLVIGSSEEMTGVRPIPANYRATSMTSSQLLILSAVSNLSFKDKVSAIFEYFTYRGGDALYHGMDDIYLSSSFTATRDSTGIVNSLVEHFKDNMREIASKLKDNCGIVMTGGEIACNHGFDSNGYYTIGTINSATVKVKGHGEIKKINGESSENAGGVYSDDFISYFVDVKVEGSTHLKFEDEYGKVIYDKTVTNPCVEGGRSSAGDTNPVYPF
ncbi:MAG: hypothetical protein H7281_12700 [Bacteriovorax sp.]|nr:hypothetical protein [Bacteriovorax sp.]